MKTWAEMTDEERREAARKGDAVLLKRPADTQARTNGRLSARLHRVLLDHGVPGRAHLDGGALDGLLVALVAAAIEDAERQRRDLGDLRLALRAVPSGGASGDAPAWIVRLHRAACEVAGIGVREAEAKFAAGIVLHDDEVRAVEASERPPWQAVDRLRAVRDGLDRLHRDAVRWLTGSDDRPNLRAAERRIAKLLLEATEPSETPHPSDRYAQAAAAGLRAHGDTARIVVAPEQTPPPPAGSWWDEPPVDAGLIVTKLAPASGVGADYTYAKGPEQHDVVCPTCGVRSTRMVYPATDPRIGRLVEWRNDGPGNGRQSARVVAIEPGSGMLLVREDGWQPSMHNYRLDGSDHANVVWPVVSHEDVAQFRAAMKLFDPELTITTAWRPESASQAPHPHDAACSRCNAPLLFSARARGDGLCGRCHCEATGTQTLADRCREAGIEPSLVLEILRIPAGRAAIADCMRRPPVRMADGSWREPTPGSEAKSGDLVRQVGSPAGPWKTVIEVDGADTWVQDGLRRQAWRTADVEVVMPAEVAAAVAPVPLAADRCPRCFDTGVESVQMADGSPGHRACSCKAARSTP